VTDPARATRPTGVDWLSLVLICASAVLCGLLELMLVGQFYIGGQIVPLIIIAAIANNIGLPLLGYRAMGMPRGAILPVVFWLLTVLFLSIYTRPEGDLLVIAGYGQQWGFYGVLLLGGIAGFVSILFVGQGVSLRRGRRGR
jgi:Family of unknown function (DUF6113)